MTRSVALQAWMLAFVALTMPGCHQTMSPYGYQGYQQYPGYQTYPQTITPGVQYQQPMQSYPSGQPYLPNGTYSPGTYSPGTTSPTYTNPGGGLQPIPESNDAPLYNQGSGQNRDVPSPYMNNFNSTFSNPGPMGNPGTIIQPANHLREPGPVNPPLGGLREVQVNSPPVQSAQSNPFSGSGQDYNPVPVRNVLPPRESIPAAPPADDFAMPIERAPRPTPPNVNPLDDPFAVPSAPPQNSRATPQNDDSPFAAPLDFSAQKPVTSGKGRFGRHPEYQWLQGKATRDRSTGRWCLEFDNSPSPADELAGHVTLAPSPALAKLQDGDFIEVQGQLDPVVTDTLGKPVYLVTELERLEAATP